MRSRLCLRTLRLKQVSNIIFAVADDLIVLEILPGVFQSSAVLRLHESRYWQFLGYRDQC
jgi:hypothetical protein